MVVFRLFQKLRYSNDQLILRVFAMNRSILEEENGKNSSSSNITQNREFVWIIWVDVDRP